MSVNRHRPHLCLLPEDDANKDIANGFMSNLNVNSNVLQILPVAGGWTKAANKLLSQDPWRMNKFAERRIAMLVDFDENPQRGNDILGQVPSALVGRVFVLGALTNPEDLRARANQSPEQIGDALAQECAERTQELWQHQLLVHNGPQLAKLQQAVHSFLF